MTAPPILRLVMTPSFTGLPTGKAIQLAIKQPQTIRWPPSRTRRNSCPKRNRARRGNRNPGDGVSAMRPGKLYRSQALAAHGAAAAENLPAAFAGIPVKEPVLPFAADFRRLILAFHASVSRFKCLWLKPLCPGKTLPRSTHPVINGAAETTSEKGGVKYQRAYIFQLLSAGLTIFYGSCLPTAPVLPPLARAVDWFHFPLAFWPPFTRLMPSV